VLLTPCVALRGSRLWLCVLLSRACVSPCCRWGGICCAPNPSVTEERFYLSEYSNTERAEGAHLAVLAFAHEAHRERDPYGGRGCRRGGCSGLLPLVQQLPGARGCCCLGQGDAHTSSHSSSGDTAAPGGPPCTSAPQAIKQQQHPAPAVQAAGGLRQPDVQLVPVDAACSTNGSSARGSGSSHGGRHFSSTSAPGEQACQR
jgi:hypothetical protein